VDPADGGPPVGTATPIPGAITVVAPVPPGFEPTSSFERSDGGQRGVSVTGRVPSADGTAILDAFAGTMTGAGWEERTRSSVDDELLSLLLERDEERFTVSVVVDGEDVVLTMMLIEGH
jgi:hypothetical protein